MATVKKAAAKKVVATKKSGAPTKTARGRAQDRALIAGGQEYEVSYVAKVTGATAADVKKAIQEQGHSRVKVVKALTGKK